MKYAGETLEITTSGLDFDQSTPLTNTDVQHVKVTVIAPDGTTTVNAVAMSWDTDRWVYLWNTPTTAGDYRVKVVVTDLAGGTSIEWTTVRLKAAPA